MIMLDFSKPIKGTKPGTASTIFAFYTPHNWIASIAKVWYKLLGWKLNGVYINKKYIWD